MSRQSIQYDGTCSAASPPRIPTDVEEGRGRVSEGFGRLHLLGEGGGESAQLGVSSKQAVRGYAHTHEKTKFPRGGGYAAAFSQF